MKATVLCELTGARRIQLWLDAMKLVACMYELKATRLL